MLVVGLTGGIGSGKSTVANLFEDLGIDVIDADVIAREAVVPGSPALEKITEHFGDAILTDSRELDRRALRKLVFADTSQRQWLESLLHPIIRKLIEQKISQAESAYCILVSPLLFETSQAELVDRVLVIDVPESEQLNRTVDRDGSDVATIKAIIEAQSGRESRLTRADDVLDNSLPESTLPERVRKLHEGYMELAIQPKHND